MGLLTLHSPISFPRTLTRYTPPATPGPSCNKRHRALTLHLLTGGETEAQQTRGQGIVCEAEEKRGLGCRKFPSFSTPQNWTQGPGCPAAPASSYLQPWPAPRPGPPPSLLRTTQHRPGGVDFPVSRPGEAPRRPAGSPGARGSCGLPYFTPLDFSEMEPFPTLPQRLGPIPQKGRKWGRGAGTQGVKSSFLLQR